MIALIELKLLLGSGCPRLKQKRIGTSDEQYA
jgi:hypothetical protein